MISHPKDIRGRGAGSNPDNRYEKLALEGDLSELPSVDEFGEPEEKPLLRTQFLKDSSKTIVTENNSPDIGFRYSVNPYRGCEHGCAYCYARPTHEYLGFSAGLDFESKIMVKENAPLLLREKLMSRSWEGETIFFSGITDCYQPIERKLQLTRRCMEVLLDFRNPAGIITKNALVMRDLDLFKQMHEYQGIMVMISVTSLDPELAAALEPRTSRPEARLRAVEQLAKAGIPVGINAAPMIPGLNDHELPEILKTASEAGAIFAGYTPVRLPLTVLPVFTEWLERHRPLRKNKVLELIRDLRGGEKLNDANFGSRMRGEGPVAENMNKMFKLYARRYGLNQKDFGLSSEQFRRPTAQLNFFD